MKNICLAFVMLFAFWVGNWDKQAHAWPCIFQDCGQFVTHTEYNADQAKLAKLLEEKDYDLKSTVEAVKAERVKQFEEAEKKVAEQEGKLGKLVSGLGTAVDALQAAKFDQPDGGEPGENPSDKPLLYSLIVAALTAAGYGGYKAHIAASVAQRVKDSATGKSTDEKPA